MKTKILKHVAIALILAGWFSSCTERSENDINKLILGKWERIADGMYENHMNERKDGIYWEFFSDGTARCYMPGPIVSEGIVHDGLFIGIGTYEIDSDFLLRKYYSDDDGSCYREERYRFKLSKNQLQLIREPIYQPEFELIYIANFYLFNRIK